MEVRLKEQIRRATEGICEEGYGPAMDRQLRGNEHNRRAVEKQKGAQ